MSNLEELCLYFKCSCKKLFVDGNDLKANIINHLPRLKTFKFNICSLIDHYNPIDLLTNEDIQNIFNRFSNNQIISFVDYFPDKNEGQYHIYSYSFTLTSYECITNNFPGRLYTYVRKVLLFDEHPFEHKCFLRIQKSFLSIEDLTVTNQKPQYEKLNNGNRDLPLIHYHHLTCLDPIEVHDDCIE